MYGSEVKWTKFAGLETGALKPWNAHHEIYAFNYYAEKLA